MWRKLRIAILLLILLFVALNTYLDRVYSTDWDIPLRVAIYPINGDGSTQAERFIGEITEDDFRAIEAFFEKEARRNGIQMERPIRLLLGPQIRELPPAIEQNAGALRVAWWSLRTRYWSWRVGEDPGGIPPDIKLFVLFHDPQRSASLPHSIGLQKGLFGIVNVFASRRMMGSNDTVIAHELLHTLGATDKYDLGTNLPIHPVGYAEPERDPLYPQHLAELMGGRIPLTANKAEIPESLHRVRVGPLTAEEIGWVDR
jgi:hypothetical protein